MLPLWFVLALVSALLATAVPLVQERFKAEGFALALWIKVFTVVFFFPCILYYGLPSHPLFYFYTALTAVLFSISDIIYFRAIPIVGSGLVTRLLPSSVIITFFMWFVFDPDLIGTYASQPLKAAAIGFLLLFFVYCASHVKRCAVSWQGVRLIWFVIFAACIGPVLCKEAMTYADKVQAPFAFIFVQGFLMMAMLSGTFLVKKPISRAVLLSSTSIKTGLILSTIMAFQIFLKIKSYQLVDNPGFASMVMFTDALWVLLIYRLIGRKEDGNIWAGLGIVACAAMIVLIKNL